MSIPETMNTVTPTPNSSPNTPGLLVVWMIFTQVVSILIIIGAVAAGLFMSLMGSGGLVGGSWSFLEVALYLPLFMLIPIIASWVAFAKKKVRTTLVLTIMPFVLLVFLEVLAWVIFIVLPG